MNVFDFENGLIFHKDPQTNRVLEVTSFRSLEDERKKELRAYACYISNKFSGVTNKQAAFFTQRHCTGER